MLIEEKCTDKHSDENLRSRTGVIAYNQHMLELVQSGRTIACGAICREFKSHIPTKEERYTLLYKTGKR